MKKIFSISLILAGAFAFTACVHEEGDIFDQSAAERLNEASDLYSARLGASPNGWAMQYYPTTEGEFPYGTGYLILMDFNADGSVTVAMNNQFTNNRYLTDTSLWEVITDDGPVLSFNSYNKCMHAFSDPEDIPWTGSEDDQNDEQGEGAGGDYEFIVVDAPEDGSYLMLKGKKRGTYNLLTPIEEGVEYESYLKDVIDFQNTYFPSTALNNILLHMGEETFEVSDMAANACPTIYPLGSDPIVEGDSLPYIITKRGQDYYLRFRSEYSNRSLTKAAQDFKLDESIQRFVATNDEEVYFEGPNAANFLVSRLSVSVWNYLTAEGKASENIASTYNQVVKDLANSSNKYTVNAVRFETIKNEPVLCIDLQYRKSSKTNKVTLEYKYTINSDGDVATLQYVEPNNDAAKNVLSTIPSISTFLNILSGQFKVQGAKNGFVLNQLRLTSAEDEGTYFEILSPNSGNTNVN